MPSFPRILQVVPTLHSGGVERAAFDMAHALASTYPDTANFIVTAGGRMVEHLPPKTHVIFLPVHLKNPISMLLNAYRLVKIIQKYDIHIVHARSRAPGWSALIACRFLKIPLVTTYHGAHKHIYRLPLLSFFKKLYNSVMARGDAVIAISDFMWRHIASLYPKSLPHLHRIYEGIDTDFFNPDLVPSKKSKNTSKEYILFCPSRISPIKGVNTLVQAVSKLVSHIPNIKLILIRHGKQHALHDMDTLIQTLKLTDYVEWHPPTQDLRPFYARAHITVVPSHAPEALGRVSLEALSMKCLLIATDVGATPEICIPHHTGYLVPPQNARALRDMILHIAHEDAATHARIKEQARAHVIDHFSKTVMESKTLALYQALTSKAPSLC